MATVTLLLAGCLPAVLAMTTGAPALLLRIDPGAVKTGRVVNTLGEAADMLASALAEPTGRWGDDVVVELAAGAHRVPPGGLVLTLAHTPDGRGRRVLWRCGGGAGSCSVHGGEAVSGWKRCSDPGCPAGAVVAPLPDALKGKRLRHLYVDGVRANRTRTNATRFGLRFGLNATVAGLTAA